MCLLQRIDDNTFEELHSANKANIDTLKLTNNDLSYQISHTEQKKELCVKIVPNEKYLQFTI